LLGAFRVNTWVAVFATTGVILSACYSLWLYRRVVFGKLEKANLAAMLDMSLREKVILVPLIALTILFGVYPQPILDVTAASVDQLINNYQAAVGPSEPAQAVAPSPVSPAAAEPAPAPATAH
jgi:NADH-quinone oxidoreductase subunit M